MIISIEGNIGAGKSTVLKELAKKGYKVIQEPIVEWSYLDKFYENPKKYALAFQVQILLSFTKYSFPEDEIVIVERSPDTSRSVFAKMLAADGVLTDESIATYNTLYDQLNPWKPDLYIYLDCPIDVCLQRIRRRGDTYSVTPEYLFELKKYYELFFKYTDFVGVDSNVLPHELTSNVIKIIEKFAI